MPSRACLRVAVLHAALAVAAPLVAYDLMRVAGGGLVYWNNGTITMSIKLGTNSILDDGSNFSSSVQAAMTQWNTKIANVQLAGTIVALGSATDGGGGNEVVFSDTVFGEAFGSSTLAVTTSYYSTLRRSNGSYRRTQSDILFNTNRTWNSYRGTARAGLYDIRRVALHELGHVLGLDHPDEAEPPQDVVAIMNSRVSSIDALQADDIEGAQMLYESPSVVTRPANDAFAAAIAASLSNNSFTSTSTNTSATKETGEPNHAAGEAGGASVWWKWTATAAGTLTVNTRGSSIDSLLAAYTGSAVGALTQIAANDDEQPPGTAPDATRLRTSLITFAVTSGTTYHIAVDGWEGETGTVILNLSFAASTAPAISTQPVNQHVAPGTNVSLTVVAGGTPAPTYQWRKNGVNISGATGATLSLSNVQTADAGDYTVMVMNGVGSVTSEVATLTVTATPAVPVFIAQPASRATAQGANVTFTATASSTPVPAYQWRKNGAAITGATGPSLTVSNVQPADAGIYTVVATTSGGTTTSAPAILAPVTTQKVTGAGMELGADIRHPNGKYYDQLLLTGSAATFTADAGQVTRLSYIDLNDDIVQVEFSGAGSVTLVLDTASGPAVPLNYNQAISYMKGHASLYLANTDSTTYISAFTVGRMTAYDPTGAYDMTKPVDATNQPANNGNGIFKAGAAYDGVADLGLLAITSASDAFGGVLSANTSYWHNQGYTGIYAPGVTFADGRVYLHDLSAFSEATPVIRLGSASNVRVTGGSLKQDNDRAVQVSGFTTVLFAAGTDSHGNLLPAQNNQGRLEENGVDVTALRVTGGAP